MNKKQIGNFGENIAQRYLETHGYRVLERNYREGFDEVDIIGKDGDGLLIFFEVKTIFDARGIPGGFMPEDHLSRLKLRRIVRACQKFLAKNYSLMDEERGWRIDLIAVTIKPNAKYNLHHYKNI